VGHRGAPRERPENSLPSFERALDLGADAIELDVHATRDGVAVVHHDPVPRAHPAVPSLASRPIASLSYAELGTFRLDDDVAIPRLDDVLALVAGRGATAYVEIKGRGIESEVVDCIRRSGARSAVHAFDHRIALAVRAIAPELPTGVLLVGRLVDPPAALRAAGARDLWQHWDEIDETLVRAVHGAGGRVVAWTVNEVEAARQLAAIGVDALCSDHPGTMRASVGVGAVP